MAASGNEGGVPISALSIQQLAEIRQNLEQEVNTFVQNAVTLQQTAGRFALAGQAVERLQEQRQGQQVLLPLTEALYVSGQIEAIDSVILEIGTGYYVEKKIDGAVDYCKRKVTLIKDKSEEIANIMKERQFMLENVTQVLEQKLKQEDKK